LLSLTTIISHAIPTHPVHGAFRRGGRTHKGLRVRPRRKGVCAVAGRRWA
jgi:hypothetical protein